jgi:hypothetical protein
MIGYGIIMEESLLLLLLLLHLSLKLLFHVRL